MKLLHEQGVLTRGGYTGQPVPAPAANKSKKEDGSSQKHMLFMREGYIGDPIISGTNQFPKLPIITGIDDIPMKCVCVLVMSNSLQPHRLQTTRLLCLWNSPGKNPGVGCHFLLQGIPMKYIIYNEENY